MNKLKLSFLLSLSWMLSACVSEPTYELEETFSLPYANTAIVNSADPIKITLNDVNDSRCPSDVVCVWAGAVTTDLTLVYGDQELPVQLSLGLENNTSTASIGGSDQYTVELLNVTPYPVAATPTENEDYNAELVVHFDGQACTAQYAPQCGLKQITCVTTPCQPIYQTYSNSCKLELDNAELAFEGECGDIEGQSVPVKNDEPMACIEIYAPVCGIVSTDIKTYSNSCYAEVAGALIISDEHCTD
ncbi:hypothetical protein A9Q99_04975 [Gammaproteobacteria bacterium 45_16_T64]|nr:hypothetical protein A9Q99_04975 [Gammaproteobacteria bacterium 45_16_T64]